MECFLFQESERPQFNLASRHAQAPELDKLRPHPHRLAKWNS